MRPAPHIENFSADRPRTPRAARSRRATLRRRMIEASIEALEARTLMAVLPPVTAASATLQNILTADIHHNYSTPTIVIDPVNPQKLVASWQATVDNDTSQDQYVQAASSVDGGATWQVFFTSTPHLDPTVATNPPTLRDTSDVTVAIGANEGIYVLSRNHNATNSIGFLDLTTYAFGPSGVTGGLAKTIGSWLNSDQILEPTIAVDNNKSTYTDTTDGGVTRTITDPFVNNVYVAWVTNTAERQPANQNPPISNRVVMISSSDFGATFTPWHVVDDSQFNDKNASPKLIISQGSFDGRVSPGAVTIVWDDFGTNSAATPTPTDILRSDTVLNGGTAEIFTGPVLQLIDATDPGNSQPHIAGVTDVPINVNIADPKFTTLSALTVSLWITHTNLDQLQIQLIDPHGVATTLVQNRTDAAGNTLPNTTNPRGIGGANLGAFWLPTTFDDRALLSIADGNSGGASYLGRFRPEAGSLLGNYGGETAAQLNGTWTLRITDTRFNAATNPPTINTVNLASLDFGSGLTTGVDRTIATTTVRGALQTGVGVATFPTVSAASPNGIGPGLTLATDNTLGAFSPYQGRIYAAYVDRAAITGNPADNTNVYLVHSDDGGLTWSGPRQVNDDFPTSDGFSEGDRPQFEPAIAVDQSTGTLVYSYLDTRYDAARARVITSVTTSIDGGDSFATSNYANPAKTAIDAITGQTLSPSPIPSNQSAGNPVRDAAFGFGSHQALAVANGVIYAGWSSNIAFANGQYLTGGRDGTQRLSIALRKMTTAAGPRIVSGTMGPILAGDSTNTSRQADGTPIANTIIVTFDRPVDPNTFGTGDVQVFYRNTDVNGSSVPLNIVGVAALNTGLTGPAQARGATRFRITFTPPAGSGVGTYSYIVGPNVNDRIRWTTASIVPTGGAVTYNAPANQVGLPVPPSAPDGGTGGTGNPAQDTTVSHNVVNTGNPADVVSKVTVHVSISHTWTADLTLTLVSPSGTRIVLARKLDGNTVNGYFNTTFDDTAATAITSANAPFNGTFLPETLLSNFNGQSANGTWTLEVNDDAGGDIGTLNAWSLQITPGQVVTTASAGNSMDQNANAVADQGVADRFVIPAPLNGSGTLTRPYDPNTLPLIVPGPSVLATHVAGAANTGDNLVLNNTASSIDLTFDRYMDASTFTPSDVLRIQGPSGVLAGPYTVTPVYNSQNVNININPAGITTSTLTVPALGGPFTIGDLNVQVNLSQPHAADLTLTLIAPNGTRIKLAQGLGGTAGKDYTDTVFDDQATKAIGAGTAPFNGTFRPVESLGALNGLDLKANGGVWTLEIVNAGGDTGALNAWSLAVTPQAGTTVYATTFRIGFPQQQLSGTYIVSLGSDIKSMAGDSLDSNHNAGVDILKGIATNGATVPITYNSTDVPRGIPDATSNNATPPVITPGVATSTIQITDSYVPTDVTVTLSINDPFDPDLEVTLIAPDGVTRVTLVNQRGQGVSTANFQGTIFNDAGTTLIRNGGAPFNGGPYKPEQSLDVAIVGNQINVNGTWTLEVKDHNTGNTGTLVSWSLTFQKPVSSSGLGEIAADRTSASFRIFTEATTNTLSSAVWTPVGPAAGGSGRGRVGGLAADPSDPSGNTVYIGGASGGVWKTTNFLTTAPGGPTYIPVARFGPTNSANIGGIAIIGRNNDPSQSIIFAATGEGDTGSPGVGFLRSMDGGATWVALDSTVNFDGGGNLLPMNSPARDHIFDGTTSFKIVADPKLSPTGDAIVYAALSGTNGGIWRSENTGRTWKLMRAGQATDVSLDLASGTGAPGGNLQNIYGAFRGEGVFFSPNRGQVWNLMAGGIGDPLIQDGDVNPSIPIVVKPPPATPNGPKGRIVLATPGLTGNATKDLLYQGWVYALVVTTNDHLDGLYVTKDFGRNWTRVRIPTLPPVPAAGGGNASVRAVPTNDYSAANPDYDVAGNAVFAQGNYDIAMTIDPTNPNVVYIGGTNDGQPSSLVRVDITYMHDAHSAVAFDETNPDGGLNSTATTGGIALKAPADPTKGVPPAYYNLNGQPGDPFGSSTIAITNTASFTNDGTDARWIPFDFTIGDNHRFIAIKDPLTGHARLIAGDDHGVWTAVDDNGVLTSGVGTATTPGGRSAGDPAGDRTGNLQIIQFYYGAAQPTGTAFYGQAQDNGSPTSGNALATGNIGWSGLLGDGTGVATDQTGSGTVYRFNWPCCGGDGTNFFQVNGIGRTQGLILASNSGNTPDPEWPFVGGVNFAVNPINGNQILISSTTGRVFSTENQGVFWSVIGEPAIFGNSHAEALAYGAPDPNGPAGLGNLDNLLYVGTLAGRFFVSQTGGGGNPANAWTEYSNGLDGSAIRSIVPNPNRGSHEIYAVTDRGVFYSPDFFTQYTASNGTSQTLDGAGVVTSSLMVEDFLPGITPGLSVNLSIGTANPGDLEVKLIAPDGTPIVLSYLKGGTNTGGFNVTFDSENSAAPALSGNGPFVGTFRPDQAALFKRLAEMNPYGVWKVQVINNGASSVTLGPWSITTHFGWTNITGNILGQPAIPAIPADGNIPDSVGYPFIPASPGIQHEIFNTGSYDSLMGSLSSLAVDWRYSIPNVLGDPAAKTHPVLYVGGNGGVLRSVTSIGGTKAWTRFPNQSLDNTPSDPGDGGGFPVVQVSDLDLALGIIDPTTGRPNTATGQNILLATTYGQGSFTIRLAPLVFPESLSLDYTAPLPPAQGGSDSGNTAADQRDGITNVTTPFIDGFSAQSAFGQVVTIRLYDLTDPTNPVQIGQGTTDAQGFFKVQVDPGHFLPDGSTDGLKTIGVQAVDQNGAIGNLETIQFALDTTPPVKPAAPDLQTASDSGISGTDNITKVTAPSFDVKVIERNAKVVLYRDGAAIVTLFDVAPDANSKLVLTDPTAPEGTHVYTVRQTDASTNLGPMSDPISVTFDYTTPTAPTGLDLKAGDDTGISATDNNTRVNTNLHFDASAIEPAAKLELLRDGVVVNTIANVGPTGGTITITDPTPLIPDGIYSYTVRQTDLAGNVSLVGLALSVTIDTTKPVAPAAPDLQAADDGGFSNTDNLTNINTNLHFDVAGIETDGKNAKVELFRDGVSIGVFLNTAGGTITFTDTAVLPDGVYTYTARQTDLAGNVSDASGPLVVTIDTSSPLIPSVPDLIDADDHGSSNADNVTNVTNPTFNIANARATAVVKLYRKLHDPLNVNDPNSDDYTFIAQITGPGQIQDAGPVADGVYDYAALQLSDAGVAGPLSAALVVTIDTAAPAVSSVPDLQPSSDHGTFNDDNITNAAAPTFGVTSAEATATVHLLRTDSNNVTIEVGTRVGPGAITDPGLNQPDGVYTYTSFQTDLAGNVGPTSTGLAVTIDRTVPAASSVPDLQAGSDSGFSSTDNITFVRNPFFDVPSAEATAIVHLLRNGVEVATRTGPGAIQDPGPVPDGVYTYTTFQTDLAGNAGPASAGLTVTIDGTAPAGPAPDLQAGSDTGQSDSDNITSATLLAQVGGFPKFDITPIEQGALVELFRNGVLVDSGRLLTNAGVITLSDRGPTFPDGQYIYTTRQTDLAGNVGPLGTPLVVTVDNTAPLSPNAPDLQAASDSGPSNTDNITAVTNPTFDIGNTEPGAILKLVRDGAVVRTLTNIAGGTVSIQDPGPVPDGTHIYSAYEIDAAGNIGPLGGAVQVVVDTLTPGAPSIPDLQAASDSGASNVDNLTNIAGGTAGDGITPLPGPTFDITNIDPGATVQLLRNGLVVSSKVNTGGVGATISITDPGPIAPDGVYNYSSRQIDAAGNSGPVSGALPVTFDTAALVPAAPDLQANSDSGDPTDNITSVTTPTFDVTGTEAGATVTLYRKLSGSADSTYVPVGSRVGDGPLLDPGPLADGTYVYSLVETDLAGNVSGRSATLAVTFLTAAPGTPAAPDLQAPSDTPLPGGIGYVAGTTDTDNVTSLHSLTFNVAVDPADAGATVQLLRNGVVVNSRVGSGTLVDVVPSDGTYSYTLQEINVVGTPSLPSAALLVKVDSLAPTTPAAPDLEDGSDTGNPTDNITSVTSPTFDVAGVEANATVQLLRNGVVVNSKANAGADGATVAIADPGPLAGGQYTYTTRIYDVAGNVSGTSPSLTVTIDTTAPPKPAAPDLTAASDSGISDTDNITNVAGGTGKQAPVFTVSGVGAGLTTQLLRKVAGASDATYIVVNTADPSAVSPVSITDPGPINDGKYVYAVRTVAPAGGQSVLSATLTVTYDTRPVAVLNPVLANPYGSRATTTVSRNPRFAGTTEPGVNVSLFVDTAGGRQKVGGAISDAATGAFSIPVAQAMLNGSYRFSLAVVDPAGNIPASGSIFGNTLAVTVTSVAGDYDGDGRADIAFDRIGSPSSWQILGSAAGLSTTNFGNAGDVPISGDFDGDGKTDIAVFRPAGPTATYPTFIIKPSGGGQSIIFSIGGAGDVPAVADYDGDGKADMAVYRPSTGQWFIRTSSSGQYTRTFGGGNDMPVPADYQGTGSAQLAVFRPSNPNLTYPLFIVQNPGEASTVFSVGGAGDVPMPADYNGDGRADFAVYRPNSSQWFVRYAGGGGQDVQVGTPNDIPVSADYDGDGKADTATYRASTGLWSINQSTGGPRVQTFGGSPTDVPVPSPYIYRQQASVTVSSGTRAASRSFDLGAAAAKLANTAGASRVQVNQVMKKR